MNALTTPPINAAIKKKDVKSLDKILTTLSGFEIADLIANKTEEEKLLIFSVLSPKHAAETFDYLSLKTQKHILHSSTPELVANMLTEMPPDDRTALFEELPRLVADVYIKLLPNGERRLAIALLGYPEDSVGRLMTTDYIAVKPDWSVEQVLDYIRAYGHDSETISVIYIIDDKGALIDDVRIREFLFVSKDDKVNQITDKKFVALSVLDSAEKAINVFKQYDRTALPAIDEEGILKGIVTIDDILRIASEINTDKMQKVGGTEALDEPYMEIPFLKLMHKRAHWLVLLFIGEMFTATAMGFFEAEIEKAVVLALFLPLIISSGGNAGSQSSTLIIRAMALGEVKLSDWWRIMKKEILSGLFLGSVLGLIGFARVTIWSAVSSIYGVHWLLVALTISLSLIGVVLWGSLTGSMLPFMLRSVGFDPATASAPLVATLVDVTGIVIYFLMAMWILKGSLL
ncbi:MAG: magnesium transporter [Chlamydiales bacterium]